MSTPEEDASAASEALADAIAGPKRVRGDAGEVEQHDLGNLIEAERYQKAKAAASRPGRGIRLTKLLPGSTQ